MSYWVVKHLTSHQAPNGGYLAQNGSCTVRQLMARRFLTKAEALEACLPNERCVKVVRKRTIAAWEPIIRELCLVDAYGGDASGAWALVHALPEEHRR